MADRHSRMLARLAELSLEAAADLHGRLLAAEAPADAQGLGLAFEKVSRSLRQTLLLEAKLETERRAAEREDEARAAKAAAARYPVRRARVRGAVLDRIAEACERPEEAEELADTLEASLDNYLLDPELEAMPFDELVDLLCHDLGLDLDDAEDDEDEDAPAPANDTRTMNGPAPEALAPGPDRLQAPVPDSS
jgi:hypothetical protein